MKAYFFSLPIAISLAGAGLLLAYRAHQKPNTDYGLTLGRPQHPVTPQMMIETDAMANRTAPAVNRLDVYGQKVQIGETSANRPQFVLFIKEGCPCSVDAQPLFNKLAGKFKGTVDFYGVIDADSSKAKGYATQFKVPFPVLDDPRLSVIHGFEAKASVYSTLVARNGHIVKMWPGYNDVMLREINATLSVAAGVPATPFDPEYAPKTKTSGCTFMESDLKSK